MNEIIKVNYETEQPTVSARICPIAGYCQYLITDSGEVFSTNYNKTGRMQKMKLSTNRCGYKNVELVGDDGQPKRLTVHRLVAKSFISKIDGKDYVNHIDGDKTNNHFSNLEWVTQSENIKHSYDVTQTQSYERLRKIGEKASREARRFSPSDVLKIRSEYLEINLSFRKLASKYNCGKTTIERLINYITYADVI